MSGTLPERLFYPERPEGPWRRALLSPLQVLAWGYGAGVRARAALYASGRLAAERLEGVRVVSVGNLNVGGAGKTPAVLHLAERLVAAGRRVAILSRGYGRASRQPLAFRGADGALPTAAEAGDEPLLLARRCPAAWVLVGADRVALGRRARDTHGADVLLLDDGFQHRRLARDEDVVVLDEAVGLGTARLLPRGPLREPPAALARATLRWVRVAEGPTRAELPVSSTPTVRARYLPQDALAPDGQVHPPGALAGRDVLALAALARPRGFLGTLGALGARVREAALFPDHHPFSPRELEAVLARAASAGLTPVTTEKDAARLPPGFPAWVVRLGVEVVEGEAHLVRALGLGG